MFKRGLKVIPILICVVIFSGAVLADNLIDNLVTKDKLLYISPTQSPDINFRLKINDIEHGMKINNVLINKRGVFIDDTIKESWYPWNNIKYVEITIWDIDVNDSLNNIKEKSIYKKELRYYDEPVKLNTWVACEGIETGRMIKEIYVLEENIILITDYYLYLYPVKEVDKLSFIK